MTFRAGLILAAILASFGFGWYSRLVYDGYRADKAANERVEAIGKAATDIVKKDQDIGKVKKSAKDPCTNTAHPAYVGRVLK